MDCSFVLIGGPTIIKFKDVFEIACTASSKFLYLALDPTKIM